MSGSVKTQIRGMIGETLNSYHSKVKPTIDDLKFRQEYQDRIIECMVGEVDDNYITTPETDNLVVKLEHSREGVVKVPTVKGKTILVDADGNETDTPAEGCKFLSVGEQEDNKLIILSKNKNLFDGELEFGYLNINNGEPINNAQNVRCKNFIRLNKNSQYKISKNIQGDLWVLVYDKNKNFIRTHFNVIPTMDDIFFIKFYIVNTYSDLQVVNIQIEENNITSYTKPKQHKTEILLNEPLRSLPNGVCDEIVGNKIIRRIGKKIIDGSERWTMSGHSPSTQSITLPINSSISQNDVIKMITCNNINTSMEHMLYSGLVYGLGYKNSNGVLRIRKEGFEDVESLVKWLSENHITLFYQLEEPIIEELPNGITLEGFDDTTMYIENSITPMVSYGYNALIPYKNELSQQKEEVEINTLDIENNIIPYLMDMEFNLMTMEDK